MLGSGAACTAAAVLGHAAVANKAARIPQRRSTRIIGFRRSGLYVMITVFLSIFLIFALMRLEICSTPLTRFLHHATSHMRATDVPIQYLLTLPPRMAEEFETLEKRLRPEWFASSD